MARKRKVDPNQFSLFDLGGGNDAVAEDNDAQSLRRGRDERQRRRAGRDLRPDARTVGGSLAGQHGDVAKEVEGQQQRADTRRDGSLQDFEGGQAARGRRDQAAVAGTADGDDHQQPAGRRGRQVPVGRGNSDDTGHVEDPVGHDDFSRSGRDGANRRAVSEQAEAVDNHRGDISAVATDAGQTVSNEAGAPADSPVREGRRSRLGRDGGAAAPVEKNLAAIQAVAAYRNGKELSAADREALSDYRAWGSMPQVFNETNEDYAPIRRQLREVLSDREYAAARRTVTTAFYTPPQLTTAIWEGLNAAGFTGGRVLEPGVGTGGFIDSAADDTHVVGIERDPIAAQIASARFPDSQIRQEDFANTDIDDNSFAATVGNVPFAQTKPYDPRHNRAGLSTHNYFISKSIDLTQPGGYVAVVTSQHSADSAGRGATSVQQYLTDRADFVTGVRLPGGSHGAFSDYAGTEAGTDVLVFRKREEGLEPTARTEQFCRKSPVTVGETTKPINAFFADNPDHVLGDWQEISTQFGPDLGVRTTDSLESLGAQLQQVLTTDLHAARENGMGCSPYDASEQSQLDVAGLVAQQRAQTQQTIGALRYHQDEDGHYVFEQLTVTNGQARSPEWREVKCAKKYRNEWAAMIDMRDTTEAVLEACRESNETALPGLRARLNAQYDDYVATYGPLNRFTVQPAKEKTPQRIQADFDKKSEAWRMRNPVADRPFEGELPDPVAEKLWDEARQPSTREQRKQLHLRGAIKNDPYMTALLSVEQFNEDTYTATKGPLFSTNPLRSVDVPTSADSVEDAVIIARTHGLEMTTDSLAGLVGRPVEEVAEEIDEKALAFRHPHRPEQWIPASQYLSGSLYPKIEAAEEAARTDSRFQTNVEHLQNALPERVTDVTMSLGATWIPESDYRDFICETLDIPRSMQDEVRVAHAKDAWFIQTPKDWPGRERADMTYGVRAANANGDFNFSDPRFNRYSHAGIAHRGHDATVYSAAEAIDDVMNMRPPQLNISSEVKEAQPTTESVHRKATAFAGTKAEGLNRAFSRWVASDSDRWERLIERYNRLFNSIAAPTFDGSQREIAGLSEKFDPYPYQLGAVERMVSEPGTLLNHVVGAGKTGSMLMGAMELKRLGIARQPWMVVPNHILDQVGIEAKQWFPGAKVLVESMDGSSRKANRQQLLAQAATDDWDLVLVSMSSFSQMSMSAEYLESYRDQRVEKYRADLEKVQALMGTDDYDVKKMEASIESFENRMEKKIDDASRNDTLMWDETRADYLIVDEAHNYKNLARPSNLADLNEEGSNRAMDLDMKMRFLRSTTPAGHPVATFATGTPIANSIAEIYTMIEYLRPDVLEAAEIDGVNSWAHTFTSKKTEIGFSAGNQIKPMTKIASYENLGELTRMCSPMIDTITREDIPATLPTLKGGGTQVVEFDIDQESKDFIQDLAWREDHKPENLRIDNGLKIMSDGQKATLSPELVGLEGTEGIGRVHAVAENIVAEWKEHRDTVYLDQRGDESPHKGGLQVVFCDRGVPKGDGSFSMYEAIRDELVANGMDKDRIRFIHDWDSKRTQLFDDCNNGKVDVLIANTAKLGTGANIQARATAIHHVDVPWRPADLEQQDGRVFRQGNQNKEVARYTYVGRGTFDGHAWATLERKAGFIDQFFAADYSMRSAEPLEDSGMDAMAHNKAVATGNPDFVRKAELSKTVEKLEAAAGEFTALAASRIAARDEAEKHIDFTTKRVTRIEALEEDAEKWAATPLEKRTWDLSGGEQTDRSAAVEALTERLTHVTRFRQMEPQPIGSIGGVPFTVRYSNVDGAAQISSPFGQLSGGAIEKWVADPRFAHSGITKEEINSKQRGVLTRMENTVRSMPERISQMRQSIEADKAKIADIDAAGGPGNFPKQAELDEAKKQLKQVNVRLALFDASDAQKKKRQDHNSRLKAKGRQPGYTLELNPTAYMVDHGMVCHPKSEPIKPPSQGQPALLEATGLDKTPDFSGEHIIVDHVENPSSHQQNRDNDRDDGMQL